MAAKKNASEKAGAEVKAAEEKTAAKTSKSSQKKETAAAAENVFIEYGNGQIDIKNILADIRAAQSAEDGNTPVKTLDVYIKPEENAAYYVVNGVSEGKKVDLYF